MLNSTTKSPDNQENDLSIRVKTSFQKSYAVTPEILNHFAGHSSALHFWLYAATMPDEFILRRNHIKKNILQIGETRFRKAVNFLKESGLLYQKSIRVKGEFVGSEYFITDFHNKLMETPKPLPVNDLTVESISDMSETYQHIIQGGDPPNPKGKKGGDIEKTPMAPFPENADPEDHKKAFLEKFDGVQTFQTFDDTPAKKRELNKITHHHDFLNLEALNDKGAGVFLTINETDGKCRKAENITKVRAVYADLDGAPLAPVLEYCPSMVVETSPGRFHAYWMTGDVRLNQFRGLQKSIIHKFGSDPAVHDLPRVMRVPGYHWNKKDPAFMSRIIFTSTRTDKFSFDELTAMFPPLPKTARPTTTATDAPLKINGACKGERNSTLCRLLGGLVKRGFDVDKIADAAYQFAARCKPPLSERVVQTTLAGAQKWR